MEFSTTLIHWYNQNKRNLPWRRTTDPYKIWLSEVILQQTRVNQGLPYYQAFVENFPTVFDLAFAEEQKVLKLWQGLGYYSRARNLHYTAKYIVENYEGVFPTAYKELLKLKGVGSYTAAAIASFSSNEPVAVVDGNVFRVLARIFNIEYDISKTTSKSYFFDFALALMDVKFASDFNQAIMEFGALQCVPKNPNCEMCVFNEKCEALRLNKVNELPIKLKKVAVKKRFLYYVIVEDLKGNILVSKREKQDIWKNLYQFDLLEVDAELKPEEIEPMILNKYENYQIESLSYLNHFDVVHKLSHQQLVIKFYHLKVNEINTVAIPLEEVKKLPFPIVLHKFIEKIVL